jgi:DoxX-like family
MPPSSSVSFLQCVVALGLLNVWLVRSRMATAFRGGSAKSLAEEFVVYGLPAWSCYVVGVLKIGSAAMLIAGLRIVELVPIAASVIAVLMGGALAMHAKVKDPAIKSLPALMMLMMCAAILALV